LSVNSSFTDIIDQYEFYNQTEQYKNAYFQIKYTIYKDGLCGNLDISPMKRLCTPYLHIHPYQTEKFFVLQGQLSYQLGEKLYSCNNHTCPSPIVIPPSTPHTFWMSDNQEDLIFMVHTEPIYKDHGLRISSYENIAGARRDKYMTLWQALVLIDSVETYPVRLPLFWTKLIIKLGALIGQLLGYQSEYDEYTTKIFD
jgi:mannose-6-phosphate isomerase-like protein (cupin superfamily)